MTQSAIRQCISVLMIVLLAAAPTWAGNTTPPAHQIQRCDHPNKKGTLSAAALRGVLHAHQEWLEQRDSPGHTRADLCGLDLRRAALEGANLERARMEGVGLRQANLRQSILTQASLAGADLTKANLEDSNLVGADLRHANLTQANLLRAVGDEAALYNAALAGAQLHDSIFERAHFEGLAP
jgi:uncharacterized protein YjbI with pentapeptide repeats